MLCADTVVRLCDDIWQAVSKTGGHLGSSLGVIELTVALHYVFDAPEDKITWDVSHQVGPPSECSLSSGLLIPLCGFEAFVPCFC